MYSPNNLSKEKSNVEYIELSQGQSAIVDSDELLKLSSIKWYASRTKNKFYAVGIPSKIKNGKRVRILMHRFIMNAPSHLCVDHINGNSLDNRILNLRLCSHAENIRNREKGRNSLYKYKGVRRTHGSRNWETSIKINRKRIYFCGFKTEIEAAIAYNKAALKYHGEYAKLNEIILSTPSESA